MPRFHCEQYPQLVVMDADGEVARFIDGACDISDPAAVEVLRTVEGVDEESAPSAGPGTVEDITRPGPRGRPRKTA